MTFLRNSLLNLGGIIGPVVIALVTTPLLLSEIGAARYGALAIVWLFLGYFGQADFGIGRAATKRIAELIDATEQERARVVWSAFLTIIIFGIVTGLLAFAASSWFFDATFEAGEGIRAELLQSVGLIALCGPIVATFGVGIGCLQGAERFSLSSSAIFISNTGLQVFPLVAAWAYSDHMEVLIAASLGGRSLGLVMVILGSWWHFLRAYTLQIDKHEVIGLLQTGKWIMLTALIGPLMIIADRFVIGALLGAVAVAAYTVPFQVASRALLFPIAVTQVMFPRLAAMPQGEVDAAHREYIVLVAKLFLPLIVGLICLAEPLLKLWLGNNLDPRSVFVAQIILAGIWFNGVANVPYSYLQARGRARFVALLHMSELPIYAVLLYGLSVMYGLPGIAAAFGIRCFIDLCGLLVGSRVNLAKIWHQLWFPTLIIAISLGLHDWLIGWKNSLIAAALIGGAAAFHSLRSVPAYFWQELSARFQNRKAVNKGG